MKFDTRKLKVRYVLAGLIFGAMFPLTFIVLDLNQYGLAFTFSDALEVVNGQRVHLFGFFAFPLIFSFVGFLLALNKIKNRQINKQFQHQAKLASIGEMAAGVGHEINNPLALVIGNITRIQKIIKNENITNTGILSSIEKIVMANNRIRKIVDGLRTYARSDSDYNEIISLKDAVDQTVSLVSEIYEKEGISIIREDPDVKLFIRGSLGKLQQIIMNFISNAKDATEGIDGRVIRLSLKEGENKTIIFSVIDNGTGISSDIRDKILIPFFTTKEAGKGTGMGLGLVSELVKKMNGELKIDTEVGEGSTFSIVLPSVDAINFEQQQQQQQQQRQRQRQIVGDLKGIALVVDDEKGIRELLVEHLEDLGLKVEEADDGDTGLEKVKQKKYDYICTDMKMIRMQGDEFIKEAKKLPNGNTKYFIVTGGITANYSKENDLWEKVDGSITKPFSEESIYRVLTAKKDKKTYGPN